MGTLLAIYCENKKRFFQCAGKPELPIDKVRQTLASNLRYCLGDNYLYLPANHPDLNERDRLCWVRDREVYDFQKLNELAETNQLDDFDVRMGNTYIKRRRETDGTFKSVDKFIPETLYNGIKNNPDALTDVSKDDFEGLCAEIFVKQGFEVDLFRGTKDGGIDFLAVNGDDTVPQIYAVQCKQPDLREGKKRRSLGRPVVQQIYGAAKAWDIVGAIAISGADYSTYAKKFAELKPDEIKVYNANDLISWIEKYRWNDDE